MGICDESLIVEVVLLGLWPPEPGFVYFLLKFSCENANFGLLAARASASDLV